MYSMQNNLQTISCKYKIKHNNWITFESQKKYLMVKHLSLTPC